MSAIEQALAYIEMGWRPIPIPLRAKIPVIDAWPTLQITRDEVPHYFGSPCNIGVILGDVSGGLVDIDLDSPAAVQLAPLFLPETQTFGRASKPRSHMLYVARYARTEKFTALDGSMIVELRANKSGGGDEGLQTVFPGSVHPSGELIEWDTEYDQPRPREVKPEELRSAVARLATAALLVALGWPHDRAVAFAQAPTLAALAGVEEKGVQRIARWLGLAVAPPPVPRTERPRLQSVPTRDQVMKRAQAYMERVPGAVSGAGGHQQTWLAAINVVRGFDLDAAEAMELMREYSRRCDPPWSEQELQHKVTDALRAERVGRGWLLEDRESFQKGKSQGGGGHHGGAAPATNASRELGNHKDSHDPPAGGEPPSPPAEGTLHLVELGEALTPELIALQQDPLGTGIADIDVQLGGGYFPGELIVLQASTGVGKTSFNLLSQCAGVASDPQRSGLYVTTEMQPHELQARRACQVLNEQGVWCNWRDVLRGVVPLERTREATANTRVHVLPIRPSTAPVQVIRAAALQLAHKYGKPPIIVADFLQALTIGTNEDRRIAVGTAAYALQALAVELRTPVVTISSISRAGNTKEKRESDDPYEFLNISKESGEIEYAAAVVAHLDVKAETDEQGWRAARFILAKTRFGNLGIVGLRFHGASGRFEADNASTLTPFDIEVLAKIHHGTYSSANAVAKVMGKNRPKVLDALRRMQARKVVTAVAGYLQIDPKIASSLTDHLGDDSNA